MGITTLSSGRLIAIAEFNRPEIINLQTNFLEELAAEWLEYNGYIVKRNERVGRRPLKGSHEGELDVIGYNPKEKKLIHIETSTDSES